MATSLIFAILVILSVSRPQDRAHGLDHESPVVLSPEMYAYLHPSTQDANNMCDSSGCSSLPLAADVRSIQAHDKASTRGRALAPGDIVGIPVGFIFACLITVGVCYVMFKRHGNAQRAKIQQLPDGYLLNEVA